MVYFTLVTSPCFINDSSRPDTGHRHTVRPFPDLFITFLRYMYMYCYQGYLGKINDIIRLNRSQNDKYHTIH